MPSINEAYTWAVRACNAPNVGYYQIPYRNQQTVNGITYYDCSSFINYALLAGGFSTPSYAPNNNAFTTTSMYTVLPQLGFKQVSGNDLKAGDIGLSQVHTEMCYKGGVAGETAIFMGAHGRNGIALANQVSIGSSGGDPNYASKSFTHFYRYGDGASGEVGYTWIIGDESEYFPDYGDKQKNNGACIYSYFYFKGWTLQAIAGFCGNVMQESRFNPGLIEVGGTGHGLVQWTPPTDLYNVLDILYGSHDNWKDGDKQCSVIYAEYEQYTGAKDYGIDKQWYTELATHGYKMSWDAWAKSTEDPGYLALVYQDCYERPRDFHYERADYARQWYDILKLIDPKQPGYDTREEKKYKLPIWMMINYRL